MPKACLTFLHSAHYTEETETHPWGESMTYEEALVFIHGTQGKKNGLQNMFLLAERLGNPQQRIPMVHVAGTNGKGSTCSFIQAALRVAGYRVGLYTSPYLQCYNERIRIDGVPIPDDALARQTGVIAQAVHDLRRDGIWPTEFEIGTALAFQHFAAEQVDVAVIEVGLGGRLDPTNIIQPRVCAITTIGLDHTKILGDTLETIAREKAGIAKPGIPLVLTPDASDDVAETVSFCCSQVNAPFIRLSQDYDIAIGLPGKHQFANATTALGVLQVLQQQGWKITSENMINGIAHAQWPGRLEWIPGSPSILLDGAHNPQAMAVLAAYLSEIDKRIIGVVGMVRDKDASTAMPILAPYLADAYATILDSPRSMSPDSLIDLLGKGTACETLLEAFTYAKAGAGPEGVVVCTGSLYLVGAMRTLLGLPTSTLLHA